MTEKQFTTWGNRIKRNDILLNIEFKTKTDAKLGCKLLNQMIKDQQDYIEHLDEINKWYKEYFENPNEDLDFIEMLEDCLDSEEIVNRLNELNDFKDNVFKVIDKKREWHLLQAKKCRNERNIKKAIKFEEAIMTLNILRRDIEK